MIESSGKSLTQIADEMGLARQSISQYLSGRAMPSLPAFKRLCQVLDCSYEDILGELD